MKVTRTDDGSYLMMPETSNEDRTIQEWLAAHPRLVLAHAGHFGQRERASRTGKEEVLRHHQANVFR